MRWSDRPAGNTGSGAIRESVIYCPGITPALYRLGHFAARYRILVIITWIVVAAGLFVLSSSAGRDTSNNLTLDGTGSQDATNLLENRWPEEANGSNPVALGAPKGKKITDQEFLQPIQETVKKYQDDPGVEAVSSPLAGTPEADRQISKDQTVAVISIVIKDSPSDLTTSEGNRLVKLSKPASDAGLKVGVGGYIGNAVSNPSVDLSVIVGIVAAILILLVTFGTLVAMGMPMVTALTGLFTGISAVYLLGQVVDVPTIGPTLATMIALGVGIDYALFMVSRHREQLGLGLDPREAAARATATAGGAVVFAGTTVILALLCLAVVKVPILSAMGYSAALAVLFAMLSALTLMPALLALAGKSIDRFKLPFVSIKKQEQPAGSEGWAKWTSRIIKHRGLAVILSLVILGVLAYPIHQLYLGQQDNGSFPTDTQARKSYDLLDQGFGAGANATFLIAVGIDKNDNNAPPEVIQEDLEELNSSLAKASGVASVSPPSVSPSGTAATMSLTPTTGPSSKATSNLVSDLRDTTIPKATKDKPLDAFVGGTTASYVDLASLIADRLLLTIGVVVLLGFILITLAFRALGIALISALMNLVTVAAAFGVTTAVFEVGRGISLVGLDESVAVVSYVPLMMFAVLFGLSMDYNVFLMSVVREKWLETKDANRATVDGLAATGRIVSAAAFIMTTVFLAFVLNGNPIVKQFGVGTAVAIVIYASLVRCVLLPATMAFFGKGCWYMPHWLDRLLPSISIEGDRYFDQAKTGSETGK